MFPFEDCLLSGQALPQTVRAPMEELFGADLRDIRVHPDSPAPQAFGARAFAFRDQIHFAPGEYDPGSSEGWRVIGHEIAHVVQQRCRRIPPQALPGPFLLNEPELEREADAAGEMAAVMHATGWLPGRTLHTGTIPPTHAGAFAIQCLMSVKDFKTATSASGFRDKIAAVDTELAEFHRLDGIMPRHYVNILAQFRRVYQACLTYKRKRPDSKRMGGVDTLIKEIAAEEVVLVPLATYYGEASEVKQWDAVELAQENYFTIKTNPSFNRDSCRDGQEILEVIRAFDQKTYGTGAAAAVVQREIGELAKLAERNTMPDTLKSIIREVTATKNIGQLDMKIWTPGAKYNNTGATNKYTLNHFIDQHRGRKWRLGSLCHELTHISIAETFGNTVIMLAIIPSATDAEIMALARARRTKIDNLKLLINAANDLDPGLKGELLDKANYPVSGKFNTYLSNFRQKLDPVYLARLKALNTNQGLDCELIEYDTVINQMSLWMCLSGIKESHPVYADLLSLAKEAYIYRNIYRTHARLTAGGAGVRQRSASVGGPVRT